MHDPHTLAHEINIPWFKGKKIRIASIWHIDPEKDGTDDSCGWFMRARHGDPKMREKIEKAIAFGFDRTFTSESSNHTYNVGLFAPDGTPAMSVHAIVLNMFYTAIHAYFNSDWKKSKKWMQENLFEILNFAENPVDSMRDDITGFYRIPCGEPWKRDEKIKSFTSTIYGWILRKERKWYQHPRWHIKHWEIQFHPWQNLKRRYWDKCSVCGKRGFKGAAISDWYGTKRWHQECDTTRKNAPVDDNLRETV